MRVSSVALAKEDTLRRVSPDEACGVCHGCKAVGLHFYLLDRPSTLLLTFTCNNCPKYKFPLSKLNFTFGVGIKICNSGSSGGGEGIKMIDDKIIDGDEDEDEDEDEEDDEDDDAEESA